MIISFLFFTLKSVPALYERDKWLTEVEQMFSTLHYISCHN